MFCHLFILSLIYNSLPDIDKEDMQVFESIKSRLICSKQNHQTQLTPYLCVDQNCSVHSLCCYICQQEDHKSHEMLNIKVFISKIEELTEISKDIMMLSAVIDEKISQMFQFIQQNQKEIGSTELIIITMERFAELKRKHILGLLQLKQQLTKLKNSTGKLFQQRFVQFYEKNSEYFNFQEQKNKQKPSGIYFRILSTVKDDLTLIFQTLERYKKENRLNEIKILELFPLTQNFTKFIRPYFSENLKGSCMKITNSTAQMITAGTQQRILAMQPCLQLNNKSKKWKIKILKLASWIGIGACHINKLKEANWNFNYSSTHHGSYFISSNGYSWSGFKPEFNSKFQPFTFKTGDIIRVEYSPREKLLRFEKEPQTQKKTYSLQIESNGDPLHPAVNLTGVGDSVEIVI